MQLLIQNLTGLGKDINLIEILFKCQFLNQIHHVIPTHQTGNKFSTADSASYSTQQLGHRYLGTLITFKMNAGSVV